MGAETGGANLVHRLLLVGIIVDIDLDPVFLLEAWQGKVDVISPTQDIDVAADLILGREPGRRTITPGRESQSRR